MGMPRGQRVFYHHLSSRSPWRRKGSPALEVPERDGMTALVIDGMPRAHPFAMEQGEVAFWHAYGRTKDALDRPVRDGAVRV